VQLDESRVKTQPTGPVVVGGVGGSGTRVVAEMLMIFGFYLGNDLNRAHDNLLYTLLFKRPRWFYKNHENRQEIATGIRLFRKLMLGKGGLSFAEWGFLLEALYSMARFGHNARGAGKGAWPLERVQRVLFARERFSAAHAGWGWKEPNAYLLVENLAEQLDGFRYIHTMRHGLDMAFSDNQQQLYNWGHYFGVPRPASPADEPRSSLQYWVKANEYALKAGEQLGSERFLLVDFDQLCLAPEAELKKLLAFLAIDVDDRAYRAALALPKKPGSMGRYRQYDLDQFDASDLAALARLGFSLD
jgi:hypothetical protein